MTYAEKHPPKTLLTVAHAILAGAGAACIFVFFYFFYYYGWTHQREFGSSMGILLYYVFPVILAIGFAASLRMRPSTKVSLALLLSTAGICAVLLEVLLTVWFSLPSVIAEQSRKAVAKVARSSGVDFDTRSKLEVMQELRRKGVDAMPSLYAREFFNYQVDGEAKSSIIINGAELMPIAGIANKVVVLCNESGPYLTFKSDIHGFNNPPNAWDARPMDIVALGDSYVHGYCAENNIVEIIRRRYPATLNLGIEGNGPLVMLATLKEYAAALKPKVVLWFFFEGNDLSDLNTERKSSLLRQYLTKGFSQGLISRQDEVDRHLISYVDNVANKSNIRIKLEEISNMTRDAGQLLDFRRLKPVVENILRFTQLRSRLGLVYGVENESMQPSEAAMPSRERLEWLRSQTDMSYDILVEAKRTVDEWGGKLYFVFLPQYYRYAPKFPVGPDRDQVLAVVNKAGIPIIDIHESFKSHPDPLSLFPFRLVGHYNQEGDRLVAEQVLRSISVGN